MKNWTETNKKDAEQTLPLLVKKLIMASLNCSKLSMPHGDSTSKPGWDGTLSVEQGNAYVATGKSFWEIGTNKDVLGKANKDYKKRKEKADNEVTYIFVTSKSFTNKENWIAEKQKDALWKEVKALDNDDLADWLYQNPAVHRWFACKLGKLCGSVWCLDQAWDALSCATEKKLTEEFFLSGRNAEEQTLTEKLKNHAACSLTIKSCSEKEGYGFIYATLRNNVSLSCKTLIIKNQQDWDTLIDSQNAMILIPYGFTPENIGLAINKRHFTLHITVYQKSQTDEDAVIQIHRRSSTDSIKAIESIGFDKRRATQLYTQTKGYVEPLLHHQMLVSRECKKPVWVNSDNIAILWSIMAATEWDSKNQTDCDILANIAGIDYKELENKVTALSKEPDLPIRKKEGSIWQVISKIDLFFLIKTDIQEDHVTSFLNEAKCVLLQQSTSYQGDSSRVSDRLKSGVASTLVLLVAELSHSQFVSKFFSQLLNDEQNDIWQILDFTLPLIAEAAPDQFLNCLEKTIKNSPEVITSLLSTYRYHSYLIDALEVLSWHRDYFSRTIQLLAKLCEISQKIDSDNKAFKVLREIFLGWIKNNELKSNDERLTVLTTLREKFPGLIWQLLIKLTEDRQKSFGLSIPLYHNWPSEQAGQGVMMHDWVEYREKLVSLLLKMIDSDEKQLIERFCQLLKIFNFTLFTATQFDCLIQKIESIPCNSLEESPRDQLISQLRDTLNHHRSLPDTDWAWREVILSRLESLYHKFEYKNDPAKKYAYLFNHGDATSLSIHPNSNRSWQENSLITQKEREQAIEKIYADQGANGIFELAKNCLYPHSIGIIIAEAIIISDNIEPAVLAWLVSEEKNLQSIAKYYCCKKSGKDFNWVIKLLKTANHLVTLEKKKALLLAISVTSEILQLVQQLEQELQDHFWKNREFIYFSEDEESNALSVAKKLLYYDRPVDALKSVAQLFGKSNHKLCSCLIAYILEKIDQNKFQQAKAQQNSGVDYDIDGAITFLEKRDDLPAKRVADLELKFLETLIDNNVQTNNLYRVIAENPDYFVFLVDLADHNPKKNVPEYLSSAVWNILGRTSLLPGQNGLQIDQNKLRTWLLKTKNLFNASEKGDGYIGGYLSKCDKDPTDNLWPHKAVRDILEDDTIASESLQDGLIFGKLNLVNMAACSISIEKKREQNNFLIASLQQAADEMAISHSVTASILREIKNSLSKSNQKLIKMYDLDDA